MSPFAISDYESSDAGSRPPSPGFAPLHSSPSTPYFSDAGYSSPGDIPEDSDYASGSEGIVGEQEDDEEADPDGSASEPAPLVTDAPEVYLVVGIEGGGTPGDARAVTPPKDPSTASRLAKESGSTPVAQKPSTTYPNSVHSFAGTEWMIRLRREYAFEMQRKIAQVSLETFMQTFMPGADLPPDVDVDNFDPVQFQGKESPMYDELVSVSN